MQNFVSLDTCLQHTPQNHREPAVGIVDPQFVVPRAVAVGRRLSDVGIERIEVALKVVEGLKLDGAEAGHGKAESGNRKDEFANAEVPYAGFGVDNGRLSSRLRKLNQ